MERNPTVSPYLLRPVRSLEEVARARPEAQDMDDVIQKVVDQVKAAGLGTHEQMNRAAMVVLKLRPDLSALDALSLVQRATKTKKPAG
jgi:hypothetical protein